MIIGRVRERANQRPELAPRSQKWQMLANLNAGRAGCNRLKLAANVIWGVRLHVEAIVLSQAAGEKDVDAGLCFAARLWAIVCRARLAQARQVIHAQANQPDRTGLEHRPAREARMGEERFGGHGSTTCCSGSKLQSPRSKVGCGEKLVVSF